MAEAAAIFGCVSASASIIMSITKTIHTLSEIRQQYKHAETTIRLLTSQLSTMQSALSHIRNWPDFAPKNQRLPDNLAEILEMAMEGCELAVQELNEAVMDVTGDTGSPPPITTKVKAKLVWNESAMKDRQQILSHHIQMLQMIIQICDR